MAHTDKNFSHLNRKNLINITVPILVALVFFVFVFLYFPFREKLQFNVDEGFNLIRSMMVTLGYPLYDQVSSDQPPLFTYSLAAVIRIMGISIMPGRILVLLFSTLLVWSCSQFVQIIWGSAHTLLLLFLLLLLPRYMELSVSIMIGLPALAMAALSLILLTMWHLSGRDCWLVLSGFALGLSILIKLFTGFLAPIFVTGMTIAQYSRLRKHRISIKWFQPALIWGLSFAGLSIVLLSLLVGPQNMVDIIQPHLTASTVESMRSFHNTINNHLRGAEPFLALGLLGVLVTVQNRRWLTLYPTAWVFTAYLLLRSYSPVYYHQQLLVTVPVVMLGAAAAGEGITWLFRLPRSKDFISMHSLLSILTLIGLVIVTINAYPDFERELYNRPRWSGFSIKAPKYKLNVYLIMREYASQTNWVVTDMPLYAVLIRKPVPPNLATFSAKRLDTGSLTEEEILNTVMEYKPEQVLMVRFKIPELDEYLDQNYNLIHRAKRYRLYIRDDIN